MDATFENRIKIMEDKFEELEKKVAPTPPLTACPEI